MPPGRQCKKTHPTEEKAKKTKPARSNNRIRRYFRNSDTDNANKACSSRDSTQDYSFPRIGSSSTSPPSTDVQHQQQHQQHRPDDRRRTVLAGGHVFVVDMFVVVVGMRRFGFGFWSVDLGEGFEEIFFCPCLWWW